MKIINIKPVLLILPLLLFINCKGQEKKENAKSENDIYAIGREIKRFNKEPNYGAYISTNNCSFEVLINDIPVIKHRDASGAGLSRSYFPINWDITQEGTQKVTVRLSPGFNQKTGSLFPALMKNSAVEVVIVVSVPDKDGGSGDEEEIKVYSTPQKESQNKKTATYDGSPSFEDGFTFEAKVPYQIHTLANAETLYTKDNDKLKTLEKEVVTKYNQIRDVYLKGSKDDLANELYTSEKRTAQQLYSSPEEIKERWDNDYQFRTDANLEFFDLKPIENYKLTFYANGKLVCLEKKNNEKSSLWGGFKRKDKAIGTTTYIRLYLYRPKKGAELQVY
ncbi:hypothetical protein [Pedobacter caeni]|uniref:hypothetical protein n=1 Tax=Pedobacter caeni TaxID=288992 RepID=UPI0009351DEB|nr:hypothetical protein [Pedobacter caeni]